MVQKGSEKLVVTNTFGVTSQLSSRIILENMVSLLHKASNARMTLINLQKLEEISRKFSVEKENGKLSIDLTSLGYSKLLAQVRVSKALIVNVPSCSKTAAEKIKEAGGQGSNRSSESRRVKISLWPADS